MDEPSIEKQQFLRGAVFGLKNVIVKSLKTNWSDHKIEIGLTDGKRILVLKVDLDDAQFVREDSIDAA